MIVFLSQACAMATPGCIRLRIQQSYFCSAGVLLDFRAYGCTLCVIGKSIHCRVKLSSRCHQYAPSWAFLFHGGFSNVLSGQKDSILCVFLILAANLHVNPCLHRLSSIRATCTTQVHFTTAVHSVSCRMSTRTRVCPLMSPYRTRYALQQIYHPSFDSPPLGRTKSN